MARGKGVKLQTYREGGTRDLAVFPAETGPEWFDNSARKRGWSDWKEWLGKRAQAGKTAPRGMRKLRAD